MNLSKPQQEGLSKPHAHSGTCWDAIEARAKLGQGVPMRLYKEELTGGSCLGIYSMSGDFIAWGILDETLNKDDSFIVRALCASGCTPGPHNVSTWLNRLRDVR